ncbi:MAG TPA: Ku protein [Candidatus Binatia bacterium]|nr:Ku protein [Candidatus Binatia bacterium]
MAARPSWRGHLKLSLVTCPVALYNAITPAGDVHFHLINPETKHRVKSVVIDATTDEILDRKDLLKGYEFSKGKYVTLTKEEIDAVRLESTKTIDIGKFVPAEDIDRLYWDNPYFLVPDGKLAAEPFAVIRAAMEETQRVALGRVVMSQRERLVALEPRGKGIVATTLRSHDEVRDLKDFFGDIPTIRTDKEMVQIATRIMSQKHAKFDPATFEDRYEDALRDLIKRKRKGQNVVEADEPEQKESNIIDLMEALQASLKKKAAARAPAKRAAAARARSPRKTAKKKSARK